MREDTRRQEKHPWSLREVHSADCFPLLIFAEDTHDVTSLGDSLLRPENFTRVESMQNHAYLDNRIETVELPLERDTFLRTLIRELSGTMQDVVGLEEASGFVSVVGQRVGDQINESYKQALAVDRLDRDQVRDVLVDLKKRIQGDFYVIEEDRQKIVFGNRMCPFAEKVVGRPAMCMMTSNVFGVIAAENTGYSQVVLEETIADGADNCRVVVYLDPGANRGPAHGREYFRK